MPRFTYRGRAADDSSVRGELEAPDEETVLANLRKRGLLVTAIEPVTVKDVKVKRRDLVVFTR